jgi:predicted  nucleic acid-binding Zn-ribbon protein
MITSERVRAHFVTSDFVDRPFTFLLSLNDETKRIAVGRMTKLAQAQARFSAALDALDKAIDKSGGGLGQGWKLKAELTALKSERETLLGRIAALEEETRVLAGLTEEVEDRLDDAIAEIRDVLAHN